MKLSSIFAFSLTFAGVLFADDATPTWKRDDITAYASTSQAMAAWADSGAPTDHAARSIVATPLTITTIGNEADEITPEIETLARGLLHDPVKIYAYCANNIKYEHYFGSKKGATLTLLEGRGNSFDTSALLVALLRASGITANYRYGARVMYDWEMSDWLGLWYFPDDGSVPFPNMTDAQFRTAFGWSSTDGRSVKVQRFLSLYMTYSFARGFPAIEFLDEIGDEWAIPHVWVEFEAGGNSYEADPSVKVLTSPVEADGWVAATGYNKSTLLTAVGGTTGTNYVTSINEANLSAQLTTYTTNLTQWIKVNAHSGTVNGFIKRKTQQNFTYNAFSDFDYVPYEDRPWLTNTTWTAIPTSWMSKLNITLGVNYNTTTKTFGTSYFTTSLNMPGLAGRKLSLSFAGNTTSLYLDDAVLSSATTTPATVQARIAIDHPHGDYAYSTGTFTDSGAHDSFEVKGYPKADGNAYAFIYGFSPSGKVLRKRQAALNEYKRQGLADSTRQVKTELLNIIGYNYLLQTDYNNVATGNLMEVSPMAHHRFGRMAQEGAFYIDMGLQFSGVTSLDGNEPKANLAFQLQSFMESALEHGVIEQTQGSDKRAVSTMKVLQLANAAGQRVYKTDAASWTTVRSALSGQGYTTGVLDKIKTDIIDVGGTALLPWSPNISLGDWTGYGYAGLSNTATQMIITGGYSGGYLTESENVSAEPFSDNSYFDPSYAGTSDSDLFYLQESLLAERIVGADPVDLASGAFTYEKTDLILGGGAIPRGLSFSRSYNSNLNTDQSVGLGLGWTHNLDIRLQERSSPLTSLGGTTPYQMAPFLAAWVAIKDLYTTGTTAKEWQTAALSVNWLTEQLRYKAVSVVIGNRTLEFIRMPDGTFTPPTGINMTLSKNTLGNYVLTERNGNIYTFNNDKYVASATDQYGKTANFTYTAGKLTEIRDCYSRTLTLTWVSGKLKKVTDSTGRDVDFGYTADNLTTASDAEDKTWTFGYNTDNQIDSITDPKSRVIVENLYDDRGRVIEQKSEGDATKTWKLFYSGYETIEENPKGGRTTYYFDDNGRTTGSRNALGFKNSRSYDGQDHIILSMDELSKYNFYSYNSDNNITDILDPVYDEDLDELDFTGRIASKTYDAHARLHTVTDNRGFVTTYTYNSKHKVETITDGKNILVSTSIYDTDGNLWKVTDAESKTTTYLYDSYGNARRIDFHNGDFETFEYSARGDLLTHVDARNVTTSFLYNKRRQLVTTTFPGVVVVSNTYDDCGEMETVTDANHYTTTYSYSPTGKLLTTTLPETDAGVSVTTNHYDERDWLETTTRPLNRVTTFGYDAAGRIKTIKDPLERVTTFDYDAKGNRTSVKDPLLHETKFTYDDRNQQDTSTDALTNNTRNDFDFNGNLKVFRNRRNQEFVFTYDENNKQLTTKTPLEKTTTQTWNDRGLLHTIEEPSGDLTTLIYDARKRLYTRTDADRSLTFGYDGNGNLRTLTDGTKTLTRTYDSRNRIESYLDAEGNLVGYQYDDAGNLKTLTYPGNKVVTYYYDELNRLKRVVDWNSRETIYTYDLAGRLKSVKRPNNATRAFTYNDADEITRIEERTSSNALFLLYIFTYDDAGHIKTEFKAPIPAIPPSISHSATFDADNQLLTFNSLSPVYDDDGNMTSGPLTSNVASTYVYNANNWLTSAGGLTYGYDLAGNRISVLSATGLTKYVVDPNAPLARVLSREKPDLTKTYYVYGLGLLYEVDENEHIATYHSDYRGSTAAIAIDDGKTIVDRIEYTPYGQISRRSGPAMRDTPFLFNGSLGAMTDANGLIHMRARFYNPFLMRFVNADPIGFGGGANWHSFANGNPAMYSDPNGNFGFIGAAIGAAIGLGIQAGIDIWRGETSSWQSYAAAGIGGAVSGATMGLGSGAGALLFSGAASGAASNVTRQVLTDPQNFSVGSLALETAGGAGFSYLGGKATIAVVSRLNQPTKGALGETIAAMELRLKGYSIIAKDSSNMSQKARELNGVWVPDGLGAKRWIPDFIVEKADDIFFVEVKTLGSTPPPNQRWGIDNYPSILINYTADWFERAGGVVATSATRAKAK